MQNKICLNKAFPLIRTHTVNYNHALWSARSGLWRHRGAGTSPAAPPYHASLGLITAFGDTTRIGLHACQLEIHLVISTLFNFRKTKLSIFQKHSVLCRVKRAVSRTYWAACSVDANTYGDVPTLADVKHVYVPTVYVTVLSKGKSRNSPRYLRPSPKTP